MKKKLVFMFIAAHAIASAQVEQADEWASINSRCAAFYTVIQQIVKPDARSEYAQKLEGHLRYAKGLHSAAESQEIRLKSAIAKQSAGLGSALSVESKTAFFRNGVLTCNSVATNTPLVIAEHKLLMKEN